MKKTILLIFLLAFSVTGCGRQDSENVVSMKYSNILVVGLDDEYAPMGFRDEQGEIVGFDIDLAKEVARRLGMEFEFKPIIWSKKVDELNSYNIDIIWNGLDITPERKKDILYSKPYMDNRQIILVRQNDTFHIRSEYDLEGRVVGTQAGSNSEDYVKENSKLKKSLREFKTYENYKEAFKALYIGDVDVLICDEIAGRYEMNRNFGRFEVVEVTVGSFTKIGIGFRKSDVELRDRIQKVFDEMIKDGTAREISQKWFQADLILSHGK